MTFKDLRKRINGSGEEPQRLQQQTRLFNICRDKSFWIWDIDQHKKEDIKTNGNCCFNHIIGLPRKDGNEKPIFDYEINILRLLDSHKHIWIKKATGLGITEFFLRYIVYCCLVNDQWKNRQVCIVTGPNIDLSIKLIKRMKKLFEPHRIYFTDKETVLQLNGSTIESFPSNHLDSFRSLESPSMILLDEADFFRKSEQEDVRHISERYIAKSDPYIIMISTPNCPGNLFDQIEREPEDTCIYKRLKLTWEIGLGKIYTQTEIDNARKSVSFEREYCGRYLGHIGNTFRPDDINRAISKNYDPDNINRYASKSMGIDPAWGSSAFGIVITQLVDGVIQVLYAEDFKRAEHSDMIDRVWRLVGKYDPTKIYIDGANPSFIRSIKVQINEDPEYEKQIEMAQHQKVDYGYWMKVLPVNFAKEHVKMLAHTRTLIENGFIAIDPKFQKLITSLHTAVDNEGRLDKNSTSYNDIFDAFRLSLQLYQFT